MGYLNASHAIQCDRRAVRIMLKKGANGDAEKLVATLSSCWISWIRTMLVVMGRSGHRRRIHDMFVLGRICFKHDASLRGFSSERTGFRWPSWWETLRVVRTAHEEQCVHGILLCLLAGHAEDPCSRGRWGSHVAAQIAIVFPLASSKKRRRGMRNCGSTSSAGLERRRWSETMAVLGTSDGDEVCSGMHCGACTRPPVC